ncbi:chaplin family protein [Nocardiopsis potens]|uniref:chaplin family protein n=1 Tax=Nocardiopsis potens TaxID=1246458 RepID=UPI000345640F|nr:chaplin family protein [Nocardiopsis potens]
MHKRFFTTPAAVALLTAGLVGASWQAAWADAQTDGSGGVASGNRINVPVDVEADLCGNSLAVLGISKAQCTEVSKVLYASSDEGKESAPATDGSGGVASGNQIDMPLDAALDICGNSAAVGGVSEADCTKVVKKLAEESGGSDGSSPSTDGSGGVASGNQIDIPVDTAVNICGNSVAVLGASKAECTTIINIIGGDGGDGGSSPSTGGSGGVASGNQIDIPVKAAVNICGNAVSVLGVAEAECLEKVGHPDGDDGGGDGGNDDGGNDDGGKDGGGEDPGSEDGGDDGGDHNPGGEDPGAEKPDEEPAEEPGAADGGKDAGERTPAASSTGSLPLTGTALGGLIAAAAAAVGTGAGAMYLTRKRRAAAAGAAGTEGAED